MAKGLNKVQLIGNLGKDAETRQAGNSTVTNFNLATARSVKNGQTGEWHDETDWHDVVLWRGENVAQYLTKGTQVYVEGRLQTRSWDGNDGTKKYRTEVVCDGPSGLLLLGGRQSSGRQAVPAAKPSGTQVADPYNVGDSDEVPF
jgi:single-strand DNA-binding protein